MKDAIAIEPFTIAVDEAVLTDLRDRIRRTSWPDHPAGAGWEYGTDPGYLRSLLATWADEFDWRSRERELNRLPHYRAQIDGQQVHFIHARGDGPAPLPIVLTHGFPSSFVEHLELLPLLTDPAAHGGQAGDAFDVVVTSLPGYGFSDPPAGPMLEAATADRWCRLLRDGLGYERFGAHGSDVGAGVTIQLGRRHPGQLVGIHLSAFYLEPPPRPWPPVVREFIETQRRERAQDVAYSRMQATRPQTVAHGLTDSPAGLAAWIIDLFRSFSDCGGELESRFTRVPSGFAVFADSYRPGSARPPWELAEAGFNITRWTRMPRGGHFAALEEPQLLAEELRAFFRPLRAGGGSWPG